MADKSAAPSAPPAENKDKKPLSEDEKKKKKQEEELSEEELKVKEDMAMLVERASDASSSEDLRNRAIDTMSEQLRHGEASLASVPLQLKYLRKHFQALKTLYSTYPNNNHKRTLADVLSMLASTFTKEGERDCLNFKLLGNTHQVEIWGHEYVRHLAAELSKEYEARVASSTEESATAGLTPELLALVRTIIEFDVKHNSEPEACDLLLEVEQLTMIVPLCDANNYPRVCSYLTACSQYVGEPDDSMILKVALDIYMNVKRYPEALRVALRLNEPSIIKHVFQACEDESVKKQLGFMLARQRFLIDVENSELNDIISNTKLSEYFRKVAEELEVTEAKKPEDVFKSHLVETRPGSQLNLDSAKQNLAATIVNAFLNVGFGKDLLMEGSANNSDSWLYKNKDQGMTAAAASVGMIHMWDVYTGFAELDPYQESKDKNIRAGALIGMGLCLNGVRSSFDPALQLIQEAMVNASREIRVGGLLGLGLAYAGSYREDVSTLLLEVVENPTESIETAAFAALSLGLVHVGSCNEELVNSILATLMSRDETELTTNTLSRYFSLALGLIFLGKQDKCDALLETTQLLSPKISKYCEFTVLSCAYAGTGNVLKIQKLLQECGSHAEEDEKKLHLGVACIGLALVAMGEDMGGDMLLRSFDHLLQYGEVEVRRAVPLALGLLSVSHPRVNVMDTLSKLSHDNDHEVSQGAILALGLIGAGTNNSRVAGLLRNLSSYYQREANHLFLVRIAQGLLYMGKGTVTLQPFHSDRFLMSPVAVAGLITLLHSAVDFKNILLGKHSNLFYFLACAMYPRFLITVNDELEPIPVSVRVGQAVDTVAQAGRPRGITGFQTHDTPVLMQHGERAELATDDYTSLSSVLEGVVILRKNEEK